MEHRAHHGGGAGDAAAPLEEVEVVHSKLVADIQFMFLYPVPDFVDGMPTLPLAGGVPHQQALAQGGAQGVHGIQLAAGVFGAELLHSNEGGVVGGGQPGGESQNQDILPGLKEGLQGLCILSHVDGIGSGHAAPA